MFTELHYQFRCLMARLIAPLMRRTGFRFTKEYRWGVTRWHRIVYSLVNTIEANVAAGVEDQ